MDSILLDRDLMNASYLEGYSGIDANKLTEDQRQSLYEKSVRGSMVSNIGSPVDAIKGLIASENMGAMKKAPIISVEKAEAKSSAQSKEEPAEGKTVPSAKKVPWTGIIILSLVVIGGIYIATYSFKGGTKS